MASDIVAYGIYPDRLAFERALEALRAAGFRNSDISAILPDRDGTTRDLAAEINTKAPEGFTTGASTGAAIGGASDGWSELARSSFLALDRSWPPARSSRLLPGRALPERPADSWEA